MSDVTPAVPAQPTPTPTVSAPTAVNQAAASGNVADYREARRAERLGKPMAPAEQAPPAKPVAAAPAPQPTEEQRQVSKRQQAINTYERTIAEQNERIARLEASQRSPAAPRSDTPPPVQAPAPAEKFPKYDEFLTKHPDASLEDWMDARDTWRDDRRVAVEHARSTEERRTETHQQRVSKFSTQIGERQKTDKDFLAKVSPAVLALKPFASLAEGEQGGPLNAIAEEMLDSPVATALMEHFTAHPAELERLAAIRSPRELIREFGKVEARLEKSTEAPAPPLKTVTSAPSPGTTLGARPASPGDPVKGAVATNNFSKFREERRAQRVAERNR